MLLIRKKKAIEIIKISCLMLALMIFLTLYISLLHNIAVKALHKATQPSEDSALYWEISQLDIKWIND